MKPSENKIKKTQSPILSIEPFLLFISSFSPSVIFLLTRTYVRYIVNIRNFKCFCRRGEVPGGLQKADYFFYRTDEYRAA